MLQGKPRREKMVLTYGRSREDVEADLAHALGAMRVTAVSTVSRWVITTTQPVLSRLRWRWFCDAGRIVGASAHIARGRFSRHHGEEGCCVGKSRWRRNGQPKLAGTTYIPGGRWADKERAVIVQLHCAGTAGTAGTAGRCDDVYI
jgi:hypothetical protein